MLGIATGAKLNANASLDHDLDLIAKSGAHAIRWYIDWNGVEPSMGTTNRVWTEPDAVVAGLHARNVDVLLGISSRADGHLLDADHVAAIGPFAAACAQRFGTLSNVLGFEGPNEVMLATKQDTNPTPERYTAMQRELYGAIKSVDAGALVGTGGIIGSEKFLQGLYDAGCRPWFDFVAWHPYTRPLSPTQSMKAGHGGFPAMFAARDIMVAAGDTAKQIWVTEYGAGSTGRDARGDDGQVHDLLDAYHRFSKHSWAGPFFWFCGWDDRTDPTQKPGDSMGLYRADDSEKPVLQTFRALSGALTAA